MPLFAIGWEPRLLAVLCHPAGHGTQQRTLLGAWLCRCSRRANGAAAVSPAPQIHLRRGNRVTFTRAQGAFGSAVDVVERATRAMPLAAAQAACAVGMRPTHGGKGRV